MQQIRTILLVESDVLIRLTLAAYLRGCGFRTIETAGPLEAGIVLRSGIAVDILFVDVLLAGVESGFGLAQWVRRNRPSVSIRLTGSLASKVDAAEKLCDGPKPECSRAVLFQRIQGARSRKRIAPIGGGKRRQI